MDTNKMTLNEFVNQSAPKTYTAPLNWDKLTDAEKLERMREIMKHNQNSFNQRINSLENFIRYLMDHRHDEKGDFTINSDSVKRLLTQMNQGVYGIGGVTGSSQGGYF